MAMSEETRPAILLAAPGTERPRRYLPKLRYELVGCGLTFVATAIFVP
jgi:hypothetical protein